MSDIDEEIPICTLHEVFCTRNDADQTMSVQGTKTHAIDLQEGVIKQGLNEGWSVPNITSVQMISIVTST